MTLFSTFQYYLRFVLDVIDTGRRGRRPLRCPCVKHTDKFQFVDCLKISDCRAGACSCRQSKTERASPFPTIFSLNSSKDNTECRGRHALRCPCVKHTDKLQFVDCLKISDCRAGACSCRQNKTERASPFPTIFSLNSSKDNTACRGRHALRCPRVKIQFEIKNCNFKLINTKASSAYVFSVKIFAIPSETYSALCFASSSVLP